ncbi:hypothetical protein GQ53DRAFT_750771 [Thozetella sp. PMI_491]|nr:hypothetical protein GQ53DRAFT_750771 [Thozetella sp. PMI_491]
MATNRDGQPRKRSTHAKSKRGCTACKQQRIRCGEEQPMCHACLVYGRQCAYTHTQQASRATACQPKSLRVGDSSSGLLNVLPSTPTGPFDVFPVRMEYRSSEVFHHFIEIRSSLANLTRGDVTLFHSSLGLAQTDPTWFQVALCLNAAYGCFRRPSYFQPTYFHHRQGLLHWIKNNLDDAKASFSVSYLSIIGAVLMSDSASGEDSSVQAHLKGVFALLDARRQLEGDCWFYESLLKQMLVMALSLNYLVRHSQQDKGPRCETLDPLVPTMYSQMLNEFLRAFILVGSPYAAPRKDGAILAWLGKTLQEAKSNKPSKLGASKSDLSEKQAWLKAVGAYALTVGSIDFVGSERAGRPQVSSGYPEINRLRAWWSDILEDWATSGEPMTLHIAEKIKQKVEWLETGEGLGLVHEISRSAQRGYYGNPDDITDLGAGQGSLTAAPELMYL